MTSIPILDVAIGLSLVYLLLALVCTTLMEWVAQLRNLRAKTLYDGMRSLFGEVGLPVARFTDAYFEHPLIKSLGTGKRRPSYVSSPLFAKAVRDILGKGAKQSPDDGSLVSPKFAESLQALEDRPMPSESTLAQWYDHSMDRVSGAYKRTTRTVIWWLALFLTVALNAGTISLARMLWQNPTLRAEVVERARIRAEQGRPLDTVEYSDATTGVVTPPAQHDSSATAGHLSTEEEDLLGRVLSWNGESERISESQRLYGRLGGVGVWLIVSLAGWIITALAVSLGAPFWFDTLSKFMQVRATGDVPATSSGAE